MAFSKEEQQIIDYAKANGKTPAQTKQAIAAFRAQNSTQTQQEPEKQTFGQDLKEDFLGIGENAVDQFSQATDNFQDIMEDDSRNVAEKAVGLGGEAFRRGGRFIGGTLVGGLKMLAPQGVEDKTAEALRGTGEQIVNQTKAQLEQLRQGSAQEQEVAATVDRLINRYETDPKFKQNVDAAGGFAEGIAEILGGGAAVRGGKEAVQATTQLVPTRSLTREFDSPYFRDSENAIAKGIQNTKIAAVDTARGLSDKAIDAAVVGGQKVAQTYRDLVEGSTQRITANLDNKALRENSGLDLDDVEINLGDMYVNAVSPGVKGKKKTVEGIIENKQNAVKSVKNIVENKANLTFRDIETNNVVSGELPSNLWEFGGSVTHQKSQVYKEVLDRVGAAADEPVDTSRIVEAMTEIMDDPVYANETAITNRAQQALNKYLLTDYTPRQIEDLIQLENDRLQAFYRGSGTQADAIVSAIVANNLRDMLDEAVEAAGGQGVKELKQQYGALKSIEGDVIHRALHNSQAREAGLVDMFGIRTIGDVAAGAAGDLGALRRGAGQIAGEGFIKALNDRDALINRMFMVADQAYTAE